MIAIDARARTRWALEVRKRILADRIARGEMIDLRGDGKAGGGLVLAVQSFAAALAGRQELGVCEWPLFSSARKGAPVRAFLRIARGSVEAICRVQRPDIVVLMNESVAAQVGFAEGTRNALYVVNSAATPDAIADRYRLGGTIVTIPGDDLGMARLSRPLGNVPILSALVLATGLVEPAAARESLEHGLEKRRVPGRLITQNLSLFDEALERVSACERVATATTDHVSPPRPPPAFTPVGAQSALRSSIHSRTAGFARPGVEIAFEDPTERCNGCALCVAQCPEGIITFRPDPARGPLVTGARFADYCKGCRECIVACPLDLFLEREIVAKQGETP
jgi:pyruvate ferredoxin oxidoreductase gamma subunit